MIDGFFTPTGGGKSWRNMPFEHAIYFLMDGNEVVYVGQTGSIYCRLLTHKNSEKIFDSFQMMVCKKDDAFTIEEGFIIQIKPKYNSARKANGPYATKCKLILELKGMLVDIFDDFEPVDTIKYETGKVAKRFSESQGREILKALARKILADSDKK